MQDRISIWACCLVCQQLFSLSWQSVAVMTRGCHVLTSFAVLWQLWNVILAVGLVCCPASLAWSDISAYERSPWCTLVCCCFVAVCIYLCVVLTGKFEYDSWNKGNKNALASINVLLIPTCLTGYNVEDMGNCPKRCELPLLTSQWLIDWSCYLRITPFTTQTYLVCLESMQSRFPSGNSRVRYGKFPTVLAL